MQKFNKGDKVTIVNYNGTTKPHRDLNYRTVGAEGYVAKVYAEEGMVDITIPTHKFYSAPNSLICYVDEVELVEGHTP